MIYLVKFIEKGWLPQKRQNSLLLFVFLHFHFFGLQCIYRHTYIHIHIYIYIPFITLMSFILF